MARLELDLCAVSDRCDRYPTALQELGIRSGDRVAYLAPNSYAQLESLFVVKPQIGAVLVPLNHRLIADDFVYINHSGARIVCAHCDYLGTIDGIRSRLPQLGTLLVVLNG